MKPGGVHGWGMRAMKPGSSWRISGMACEGTIKDKEEKGNGSEKRGADIMTVAGRLIFLLAVTAALNGGNALAETSLPPRVLSESSLRRHPGIVLQGLTQSLIKGDVAGVRLFLPEYHRQQQSRTDALSIWAGALLARDEGRYGDAIARYRKLISAHPELQVVRFQLAVTLYENQDNDSALRQFQRLRSGTLPFGLNRQVEEYIRRIQARDSWNISVGLSYLDESNINNAPPAGTRIGHWQAGKPESGQGVEYGVSAAKTWPSGGGWFSEYRFSGQAEQYWNNHKYDRFMLKNSAGMGFRDVNMSITVLPFLAQSFYGGGRGGEGGGVKPESVMPGGRTEFRRFLTPQWRLYGDAEYGVRTYRNKSYLDGGRLGLSGRVFYLFSPQQYVWGGLSFRRENTAGADNAGTLYGLSAGWRNDWQHGISWRVQAGYGIRQYDGVDFLGIRQRSYEYTGVLTLWSRNVYVLGVTPKVSWIYNRADSNHPFYDVEKSRVVWSLDREF
ncbi:hypothetical protein DLN99_23560 [Salmonella enterica]|nr:hypothetical protein [Salmonella enterica]